MNEPSEPNRRNGSPRSPALSRYLPVLRWARDYRLSTLGDDALAAVIVTIMLVPQSLAYAMLAGLPPEVGLYASVFPLIAYALFGTSRTLAVGPVAVVSLMTAAAVGQLALPGTADYVVAALVLALLSGLMLVAMGALRLGFLANFLSHPVISGFITASGILIAASQIRHILGIEASGHTLYEIAASLAGALGDTNLATLVIGGSALAFLFAVRRWLKPLLTGMGVRPRLADIATKLAPIIAVVITTAAAALLQLPEQGVAIVGAIPQGLPPLTVPSFDRDLWLQLAGAAAVISIIGFVESVSVGQTLAAKRRERIDPDQELIGLGTSNIAAAFSGGYPVTGGFARSVVNFDAGARTPAAGALTAGGIALATLLLTPYLYFLPQATLAATIIVAVLSLVDFGVLRRTWSYSKKDFAAVAATILVTLGIGVEAGVLTGVVLSIALFLYRTSRPHMAVVGLVPGTEHFRNVLRHKVKTSPHILSLRVDESLYFANARYLEERIYDMAAEQPELRHVVLLCTAVNEIDASALESLETINQRLKEIGVTFHLSEVKGPVMDRLQRSDFLHHLTGQVFLSHYQAIRILDAARE
jgi:sulfate permease, SulP family